jgi:hypothetical protein
MNTMLVWLLFLPNTNLTIGQTVDKYATREECQRVASVVTQYSAMSLERAVCVQATIVKE